MERFTCIWLISCAVLISTCNGQMMDVGCLNFQVNSLNRKTDFLQNEVTDLWAAVLTPGFVGRDSGNQTKADNPSTNDSRDCSIKVNEALTSVQELKSDVNGLMTTSRDGLKNEKTWQREMGKNVSVKLQDLQTEIANNNQDVKLQINTLDIDFNVKLETINSELNLIKQENMNGVEAQSVINKGVSKTLDELEAENKALTKTIHDLQSENENMKADNLFLKQTIKDIKMDLKAMYGTERPCQEGWKRFQRHCYLVVKDSKTFDDATAFCEERNAYLTEITSDDEFDFVNALARVSGVIGAKVGGIYNDSKGRFVYKHSGQVVPEKYWNKIYLDRKLKDQNCAYLLYQKLTPTYCGSNMARFICEKSY